MLAVCLIALQCTGANDLSDNPDDKQITEDSSAVAEATTTKEPQAAPNHKTVTLPEVSQSKPDLAGPDVLDAPANAALSEDPLIKTTTDALPTNQPPQQPSSTDLQNQNQQQPQLQQANPSQTSGVKAKEDHAVIPPKVDNPHKQDATQSEADVKTPLVHTLHQSPPALPSSEQSKQQDPQQPQQPQQSQTLQVKTSTNGATSQGEISNASQPGQIPPPKTTTAAETERKNNSAEEATTTTVAPTTAISSEQTTTSQKQTKLPQSAANKNGSSSTSLLIAFAILVTISVIPVTPAY